MKSANHPVSIILVTLCITLLVSGCAGGGDEPSQQAPGGQIDTLPIAQAGDEVVAEGEVVPVKSVELRFEQSGIVDEILVEEGSTVETDAELARLDTRDLVLAEEEAKANLAQSKADYDQLVEGATPEDIAIAEVAVEIAKANLDTYETLVTIAEADVRSAEAAVAQAQGQLMQVRGAVTPEDINSAHASIEYARLQLADELDGPKATEVQQSQAALDQAVATLKEKRDTLSKAKTNAYLEVQIAANTLRDRQAGYSRVYWDNRNIEEDYGSVSMDLPQDNKDNEESNLRFVENAELSLQQAQMNYENARLAEITGIQVAEANVRQLQAQHTDLIDGSDPDVIAGVRANVASAEAMLASLQGEKRQGDLMVAEAGVTSAQIGIEKASANLEKSEIDLDGGHLSVKRAQAELDKVIADPRKSDLDKTLAIVQQREVALKKAQLNLEKAAILAPFDGTIVEVNPTEGEWFGTSETAIVMADFSDWQIETTDLDELAVVNIAIGSLVTINFDALPDLELPGKVVDIQNYGKNYQGDIVYKVTVKPDQWDDRLRWNMTATVSIKPVEQKKGPGKNQDQNSDQSPNPDQDQDQDQVPSPEERPKLPQQQQRQEGTPTP